MHINSVCGRGNSALLLGVSSLPSKLLLLLLLLTWEGTREADVTRGLVSPVKCLSHQLPRRRRSWKCALSVLGRKCSRRHGFTAAAAAAAFGRLRGRCRGRFITRERFTRCDFNHRVNAFRHFGRNALALHETQRQHVRTHMHPQSHMLICFFWLFFFNHLATSSNFLSPCCGSMQVRLDISPTICNEKTPGCSPGPSGQLDP